MWKYLRFEIFLILGFLRVQIRERFQESSAKKVNISWKITYNRHPRIPHWNELGGNASVLVKWTGSIDFFTKVHFELESTLFNRF